MQTRPYSDLYTLIEGLCGVQFSLIEQPRINSLMNSRAQRAYDACEHWPRWIKIAEEREVSSSVIPFSQSGLDEIGEFLRVFVSEPYGSNATQEYDYFVTSGGATLLSGGLLPDSAFVTYRIAFDVAYGNQPSVDAIPREWFQYLAHGTYSDYLRSEGQQEKAIIADQEAEDKLFYELSKPEITRTAQLVGNKVSTNLNMQPRQSFGSYYL